MTRKLLLFDIDGTLMRCGRQVGVVFLEVLEEVFGPLEELGGRGHSFAGKTDPKIILDIIRDHGYDDDEILRRLPIVRSRYVPRLERTLDVEGMVLLPGVRELLDRLAGQSDRALGLVTGNWEAGARIKLSRFELNHFFPFGAFGDDGVERRALPPVALERAQSEHGCAFDPENVLIIGDTVHDIDCGRAHGFKTFGVATGSASLEELARAGADWVAPSLEDMPDIPHLA